MRPRQIITAHEPVQCAVCRRTLLRGEKPIAFITEGKSVMVCELCEPRAAHEGWIREGVDAQTAVAARRRDRKSLLRRFRVPADFAAPKRAAADSAPDRDRQAVNPPTEGRNVHGVPTNLELKLDRAIEVFNSSSLPHRMAGICRSLGSPVVSVIPSRSEGAIVQITVAWELAWYRFEVDLGDEAAGVRPLARGTELGELDPAELVATNALTEDGAIVDAAD